MATHLAVVLLAISIALSFACGSGSEAELYSGLKGRVFDKTGQGLNAAKVYLVPVANIDQTRISQANILSGATTDYDEPLEDSVRLHGASFLNTVTGADGSYYISASIPVGSYYLYAEPATSDNLHLPGGSRCRIALDADNLNGESINIEMSSVASSSATYIGSTACLECHSDHTGMIYTAHKQGISNPKSVGTLQNRTNFPNFGEGTSSTLFKSTSSYLSGTVLTFGDYDATRGTDKFKVYEDAALVADVYGKIYLWKNSSSGNYTITLANTKNPTSSDNLIYLNVKMTYGGTLYKQNYLVDVPSSLNGGITRKGSYPLLQFQGFPGISQGKETNYDRTASKWRDYNIGEWWNSATNVFKAPSTHETFEAQCASCHFNGYNNLHQDGVTSEWLADAVNDVGGAFDIDLDGNMDEVNIGCESCHGPGSEHQSSGKGQYIVSLSKLSPSRENMVCGRCHESAVGIGSASSALLNNDEMLFDSNNKLPAPGISRSDFLANHTSVASANLSNLWGDKIHSKANHQQYTDFLKSKHYRNSRQLLSCSDCHDVHADSTLAGSEEFAHNLKGDPANPVGDLCMRCHALEYTEHMNQYTGAQHMGLDTRCSDCHMTRTAKSGAGKYGLNTTAGVGATTNTYLMGDVSSHVFDVVDKLSPGVAGVSPGSAMPSPYTNKCGACHYVSDLSTKTAILINKGVAQ